MEIGLTELEWPAVPAARCWEARDSAAVVDAGSGACGASASATWAVLRACTAGRTAPAATAATRMVPGVERGENREVPRVVVRVPLRENGTVSGSPRPCRGTVTSLVSTTGPAAQWGSCRRDLSVIGPSQHSEPSHGRAEPLRRPGGLERASSPCRGDERSDGRDRVVHAHPAIPASGHRRAAGGPSDGGRPLDGRLADAPGLHNPSAQRGAVGRVPRVGLSARAGPGARRGPGRPPHGPPSTPRRARSSRG